RHRLQTWVVGAVKPDLREWGARPFSAEKTARSVLVPPMSPASNIEGTPNRTRVRYPWQALVGVPLDAHRRPRANRPIWTSTDAWPRFRCSYAWIRESLIATTYPGRCSGRFDAVPKIKKLQKEYQPVDFASAGWVRQLDWESDRLTVVRGVRP